MNLENILKSIFFMPDSVAIGIAASGLLVAFLILASDFIKKRISKKIKCLRMARPDKAHGILFGKKGSKIVFSPVSYEGSVGVFSSTGTGKTSSILIPTLRSWTGTSFVIDISGDINKNCPTIKDKLIYDPEDPNTLKYNAFGPIDDIEDPDEQDEALAELVHLLAPDDPTLTGSSKFFYEGGQEILLAAFISFYHENLDFIDICKKINDNSWQVLFNAIDATGYAPGISHLSGFDPDRPTDNGGCMSDAKKAIKFFATNHKVMRSLGRPKDDKPYVVGKQIEKHSIMIVIEDEKLELYSPLLNLIVSQQMQYISSRKVNKASKQILMALDEYASIRISKDIILGALRKYRKKLCRLLIFTQSIADLDILYGHDSTRALLANLKFKVLLGGLNEPESQKYFSELIGYKIRKRRSTSKNANLVTTTESETREYVIEPAELDRLGTDTALLIFPSNNGYLKLRKNFYFKK